MSAPDMPTVIWAAPYPDFMQCGDWDVVDRGTPETPATSYTRTDLIPSDPRVTALVDAASRLISVERDSACEMRAVDDVEAAIADLKGATTRKEVMPDDNDNSNPRPDTGPGVTAGAVQDVVWLVDAVDACRIIDAAVSQGHDNVSDLIMHLLSAAEPARAALAARARMKEAGE